MTTQSPEKIKEEVRQAYGRVAKRINESESKSSCCGHAQSSSSGDVHESSCCGHAQGDPSSDHTHESSCCGHAQGDPSSDHTHESSCCAETHESSCCERTHEASCYGPSLYSSGETADLPDSVTEASLGCGNPSAIAGLQPGEVVLDLGSGGGIDCFLAAKMVGPTGRVIGLDMTPEMIKLARRNAKKVGVTNVDFRYGEMEEMPIEDAAVDVILSNCVINLSPDKDAVFAETFRVLKPGGRLAVSDIVTKGDLPPAIRDNMRTWAGCVSGALDEVVYLDKMRAAGLTDMKVTERAFLDVDIADSDAQEILAGANLSSSAEWLRDQLAGRLASVTVQAHKPA